MLHVEGYVKYQRKHVLLQSSVICVGTVGKVDNRLRQTEVLYFFPFFLPLVLIRLIFLLHLLSFHPFPLFYPLSLSLLYTPVILYPFPPP
jgi:hypothetical protein